MRRAYGAMSAGKLSSEVSQQLLPRLLLIFFFISLVEKAEWVETFSAKRVERRVEAGHQVEWIGRGCRCFDLGWDGIIFSLFMIWENYWRP